MTKNINNHRNSPNKLISTSYHSKKRRKWYLIRVRIMISPTWQNITLRSKFCIFREIAYVNNSKEVLGLGYSYLPLNWFGIKLFIQCICPFKPKPVGVVLKLKYNNKINIKVLSNIETSKNLSPYRTSISKVNYYKRILSIKNEKDIMFVEEYFII